MLLISTLPEAQRRASLDAMLQPVVQSLQHSLQVQQHKQQQANGSAPGPSPPSSPQILAQFDRLTTILRQAKCSLIHKLHSSSARVQSCGVVRLQGYFVKRWRCYTNGDASTILQALISSLAHQKHACSQMLVYGNAICSTKVPSLQAWQIISVYVWRSHWLPRFPAATGQSLRIPYIQASMQPIMHQVSHLSPPVCSKIPSSEKLTSPMQSRYVNDAGAVTEALPKVWPLVEAGLQLFIQNPTAVERICRSPRYALRTAGKLSQTGSTVATMMAAVPRWFAAAPHSCFLYLASELVKTFGDVSRQEGALGESPMTVLAP